ncbi:unnamed protein product [Microthlaspi erraticum]|uniref:3-oxoacyl-[acyl-carrier-protein] reductase n=1 Tax=Microthlaspi erraticum TaxID=1685480 RepID=A0A6D2L2C1_9BRAS|nr:unnamed protein product [Microthlaspi erraticum]
MDMINIILNILLPPLTFTFLFFFYPIYLLFKLLNCVRKHICIEDVAGKVVLITGASSGIGEHLAYEYAKKGAQLALVALTLSEDLLQMVAEKSRQLGSPNVIVIAGDVRNVNDCKKFIDETILHFGKLDHLVNNAGVNQSILFEDLSQVQDATRIMDTNFWGAAYITYYAIPHLRKIKGKIIVTTSASAKIPIPLCAVYSASKAALVGFFEALKVELNPEVKVTIVLPGAIATDMSTPEFVKRYGSDFFLSESVGRCAKNIFKGINRGEAYIEEPSWIRCFFLVKNVCPEVIQCSLNYNYLHFVKPYSKCD